jgi:methyl-accepting chemotaxis protein
MAPIEGAAVFKGFKSQVVLPVAAIAMLLVTAGAVGFSYWATKHEETVVQQQVKDKLASLQAIFVTTAQIMDDRTHASMALLEEQINSRGGADRGPPTSVHTVTVGDILVGGKSQAGNFEIVDFVTRMNKGTATIFSKDGARFVRIATNVKKADGSRAVGTELDVNTKAYASVSQGQPFFGVVDILGSAYFTGYEPLTGRSGDVLGLIYVGYKAELPILSEALDNSHLLDSGFAAVVDDSGAVRYRPSWVNAETVQEHLTNADGSWVISRERLPEWGLSLVSAYPASELQSLSRKIGYGVALAGSLIGAVISLALFLLLDNKVLNLLGGEPRAAANYMKRIADGDLAVDVVVAGGDNASLMASLKVMQLKLRNLVAAVRGGAVEVGDQARKFEVAVGSFQRNRDDGSAQELLRQTKAVSTTLATLDKSVGRFKI